MRNKKLLLIGFPAAVVLPLLIISLWLGPQSIYIWAGVGLGMVYLSWRYRKGGRVDEKAD